MKNISGYKHARRLIKKLLQPILHIDVLFVRLIDTYSCPRLNCFEVMKMFLFGETLTNSFPEKTRGNYSALKNDFVTNFFGIIISAIGSFNQLLECLQQ